MADDALDEIMGQLFRVAPELGAKRISEIATVLRRDVFGGRRMGYVRKEPAAGKAFVSAGRLAAGASLREAVEAAGFRWGTGSARRFVSRWGFN